MPEIRDMSYRSERRDHFVRAATNLRRWSVQRTRIEIALHRNVHPGAHGAGMLRRGVPIDTDGIGLRRLGDLTQRPSTTRAEGDEWHTHAAHA
jgi:hypothetical protein